MKQALLVAMLAMVATGCDQYDKSSSTTTGNATKTTSHTGNSAAYDADNTGKNTRDSDFKTLTAGDQSESEEDRTITQEIRRAVVADDNLSTNAKNIKIITVNRVVALRGPVNSAREKEEIARKASAVKGIKRVENYLEIVQKP